MTESGSRSIPSARDLAGRDAGDPPAEEREGKPTASKGRGRRGKRGGKRKAPPPARSITSEGARETEEAGRDVPHLDLVVEGETWRATVLGRGRVGRTVTAAPVMLVGFTKVESPEDVVREAWVTGDRLDGLTGERLAEVFATSRPGPRHGGDSS